jgi:hypothetical protein
LDSSLFVFWDLKIPITQKHPHVGGQEKLMEVIKLQNWSHQEAGYDKMEITSIVLN